MEGKPKNCVVCLIAGRKVSRLVLRIGILIRLSCRARAKLRRAAAWQRTNMAASELDRTTIIPHTNNMTLLVNNP